MARFLKTVNDCENWKQLMVTQGFHCWNCIMRNGYPLYGQPDKKCENYKYRQPMPDASMYYEDKPKEQLPND